MSVDHGVLAKARAETPVADNGGITRKMPDRPEGRINSRTMKGKRDLILRRFFDADQRGSQPTYDSVLDLNYDGFDDYVIGWYGASGTGFKNGIDVYLYSPDTRSYRFDSVISSLRNPGFFLDRRRITGFYIGYGGGNGSMLEWKRGRWRTTRTFDVSNDDSNTKWIISFPGSRKPDSVVHAPYQMVPPDFALETDLRTLGF